MDSEKTPITSTEIWTLVHLTENWFSYQGEEFRRRSDICLSHNREKGKDELFHACPVVHRRTFPKDFPSQSFEPGSMDSDGCLFSSQIHTTSPFSFEATHPGPYHAPPQSSQCPYGQRLDMQPSQTLEATVAASPNRGSQNVDSVIELRCGLSQRHLLVLVDLQRVILFM